jgi:hypothetical protein
VKFEPFWKITKKLMPDLVKGETVPQLMADSRVSDLSPEKNKEDAD